MHLHDHAVEGAEGVVQGPRVVSQGARVDHDRVGPARGAVHQLDELALVIRLVVL